MKFFQGPITPTKALLLMGVFVLAKDLLWRISIYIPINLLPVNLDLGVVLYIGLLLAAVLYLLRNVLGQRQKLPRITDVCG